MSIHFSDLPDFQLQKMKTTKGPQRRTLKAITSLAQRSNRSSQLVSDMIEILMQVQS